jgi:hypothetical protein
LILFAAAAVMLCSGCFTIPFTIFCLWKPSSNYAQQAPPGKNLVREEHPWVSFEIKPFSSPEEVHALRQHLSGQ